MATAAVAGWQALKSQADASAASGKYIESVQEYKAALKALEDDCVNPGSAEKAGLLVAQGGALLHLEEWAAAAGVATRAVETLPSWDQGWQVLGQALQNSGNAHEARRAFHTGLQVNPDSATLAALLAEAEAQDSGAGQREPVSVLGCPEAMAADSDEPTSEEPGSTAPCSPRGEESEERGAATAAAAEAAAAAEVAADAHRVAGNDAFRAGLFTEALRCYDAALECTPGSAPLLGNRSAAATALRRFPAALADGLAAAAADPGYGKGLARAARAAACMGRWEQADCLYARAAALDPAWTAERVTAQVAAGRLAAGAAALEAGDAARALSLAEGACAALSPPAEPARALRAEALLALGRPAEALAEARRVTAEGEEGAPAALTLRGRCLYACGNLALAEQCLARALAADPDCPGAARPLKRLRALAGHKERGNAAFRAGRWQEAWDAYTAALGADPELRAEAVAQVACNRSAAAAQLGRWEDALADADAALGMEPGYAKARARRAAALGALGRHDEALAELGELRGAAPEYPGLERLLADARLAKKKAERVDYYAVLGLEEGAEGDAVKKAYRRAALKSHPDKADEDGRASAEVQFKLVGEAYAVLSDPVKRQRYDAGWSAAEIESGCPDSGRCGGGGSGGSYGYGGAAPADIFAQMFQRGNGFGAEFGPGGSPYGGASFGGASGPSFASGAHYRSRW